MHGLKIVSLEDGSMSKVVEMVMGMVRHEVWLMECEDRDVGGGMV